MTCPNCGAENNAGYQFCQRCGARLAAQPAVTQPVYSQPQQPQYQQPQYQQPQQPSFQQPQKPVYQQPQQPQWPVYGQPQQGVYGQPQQGIYGQPQFPQQPVYPQQPGYPQPQQPAYPQPRATAGKKKFGDAFKKVDLKKLLPANPKKLLIPGIIAVVAIIAVVVLLCLLPTGSGQSVREMNYYTYYNEDDEVSIFADGELLEEGLEYEIMSRVYSLDGKVMVYLTDEDELYVARNGKIELLAEEVESFELSEDGSTVACVDQEEELYLYDTKSLEGTSIAEEAAIATLSPDGKTLVYTCEEGSDEEIIMYYYDGKKSEELGENLVALSVSNGGKYIYAYNVDKDTVVAMNTKGDSLKIGSSMEMDYTFYVNSDHSQFLYCADGKWYVSVKGGEKIKLSSKIEELFPVQPHVGPISHGSFGVENARVKDLSGRFYMGDDTLYFLNSDWELEEVADDVEIATISTDGKTVYYLDYSANLCKVTAGKLDEPIEIADDVYNYRMISDGSAVYYLDNDDSLFYCKGTKDAAHLADDVYNFYITHDDICFFIEDFNKNAGDLYMSKNGGKKEMVFTDCYRVFITSTVTYAATDYDSDTYLYTMYVSSKGDNFDLMVEP